MIDDCPSRYKVPNCGAGPRLFTECALDSLSCCTSTCTEATKAALATTTLLAKKVVHVRVTSANFTVLAYLNAIFSAAVRFKLWHYFSPSVSVESSVFDDFITSTTLRLPVA